MEAGARWGCREGEWSLQLPRLSSVPTMILARNCAISKGQQAGARLTIDPPLTHRLLRCECQVGCVCVCQGKRRAHAPKRMLQYKVMTDRRSRGNLSARSPHSPKSRVQPMACLPRAKCWKYSAQVWLGWRGGNGKKANVCGISAVFWTLSNI